MPPPVGTAALLLGLVCLFILAGPLPARATLVMETQAQARVEGGELVVRLKVRNRGDEKALALRAEVIHPAGAKPGRLLESLAAGGESAWTLRLPCPPGRGRGALILRLRYQDGNHYPFSALSWAYYHRDQDRPGILAISAPPLELGGEDRAALEIRNPGPVSLQVEVLVFTPAELKAQPARQGLSLPARGREELEFDLVNLSGLAGSSYPVLVLLRYRLGQLETAQVANLMVKLVSRQANFFRRNGWWLAGLVGLFLALFLWSQLAARRRRSA